MRGCAVSYPLYCAQARICFLYSTLRYQLWKAHSGSLKATSLVGKTPPGNTDTCGML